MVNFGLLTAEICWRDWGTPANFNGFARLGNVTARHSSSRRQPNFAALNRGRHLYSAGRPSRWALAHISSVDIILPSLARTILTQHARLTTSFWLPVSWSLVVIEAKFCVTLGVSVPGANVDLTLSASTDSFMLAIKHDQLDIGCYNTPYDSLATNHSYVFQRMTLWPILKICKWRVRRCSKQYISKKQKRISWYISTNTAQLWDKLHYIHVVWNNCDGNILYNYTLFTVQIN